MSKPNVNFPKEGSPSSANAPQAQAATDPTAPAAPTKSTAAISPPEKKTPRIKKVRKANPTKVRVKLPPIESYEKELEFSAEGPGRVVVRLERLMGTDRVRILDTRYMTQLLERLEGEEKTGWMKRTRRRKNDERNRFRQLAIEGYMEPDPDMQDLYNHPVFRVNRILNRLARLDNDMGLSPPKKLPMITPCEPLVDGDPHGHIFKTYPGHTSVKTHPLKNEEEEDSEPEAEMIYRYQMEKDGELEEFEFDEDFEENAGEDDAEGKAKPASIPSSANSDEDKGNKAKEKTSMETVKMLYGVAEDENLEDMWQPYHSALVDLLYMEDTETSAALYEISKAILDVYRRENRVADDFCIKLNRLL